MSSVQYRDIPDVIAHRYAAALFARIGERRNGEVFFVRIVEPISIDACGPPIKTEESVSARARIHTVRFVVRLWVDGWSRRYILEPYTPDDRELLAGIGLEMERDDRDWAPIVEEFRSWGR